MPLSASKSSVPCVTACDSQMSVLLLCPSSLVVFQWFIHRLFTNFSKDSNPYFLSIFISEWKKNKVQKSWSEIVHFPFPEAVSLEKPLFGFSKQKALMSDRKRLLYVASSLQGLNHVPLNVWNMEICPHSLILVVDTHHIPPKSWTDSQHPGLNWLNQMLCLGWCQHQQRTSCQSCEFLLHRAGTLMSQSKLNVEHQGNNTGQQTWV